MAQNQGNDSKNIQQDGSKSDQNRNTASSQGQQSQQSSQQQSGKQQSGQQGSQQHGGQHASGGTPALDNLDSKKKGESAHDAAQAFNKQKDDSGKR